VEGENGRPAAVHFEIRLAIARIRPDVIEVGLGTGPIGVVANDQAAVGEATFQKLDQRQVQVIPSIEKEDIDAVRTRGEGLHGIALAQIDVGFHPRLFEILAGHPNFLGQKLRRHDKAIIDPSSRSQIQGGNPKGRPEFNYGFGPTFYGQVKEQTPLVATDSNVGVLHVLRPELTKDAMCEPPQNGGQFS